MLKFRQKFFENLLNLIEKLRKVCENIMWIKLHYLNI